MAKVFISHSWDDNSIAKKLEERLRNDGAEIWVDYDKIKSGDSFIKKMNEGLEWCDTLILVWSKSASKSHFVTLEWEGALANKLRIIPCLLDKTRLPFILSGILYRDLSDFESGYHYLAKDLSLTIKKRNTEEIKTPEKVTKKISSPIFRSEPQDLDKNEIKTKKIKTSVTAPQKTLSPIFRSKPQDLDKDEVKKMLKKYDFFCKEHDWTKEFCHPTGKGYPNDFVLQKNGLVVYDRKSGLMWQQSGSENYMTYEAVEPYIAALNRDRFAGLDGWRLPTLEEAMSLMEPEKNKEGRYINPIFDKIQGWIWTSDPYPGASRAAWVVSFTSVSATPAPTGTVSSMCVRCAPDNHLHNGSFDHLVI